MNLVGILLAAGKGERFDPSARRLKLLESCPDSTQERAQPIAALAARALRAVTTEVIAVVRTEASANQEQLRAVLIEEGCTLLPCEAAKEGMGASIACAIRASAHAQGWIIALADMPQVQQATIAAVRNAIVGGAASAAPFYRGQRGHPVGFGAACGAELAQLRGDTGAREVLRRHPPMRIDVDDPGVLCDIDEPADLAQARARPGDGIS
ncbi:MAG TPA: nucleotidyltransferase family protein [Burkholderiaceae bacterium]|nr:nucleotidyltransferase family protein [Burkholderiaceae bacterium]